MKIFIEYDFVTNVFPFVGILMGIMFHQVEFSKNSNKFFNLVTF